MRNFLIAMTLLALGISAPADAQVTLVADQDVFEAGSPIGFKVTNDSPDLIYFGSSAPYAFKNLDSGEFVYFVGLAIVIGLAAGQSQHFEVPADEIEPGHYEIQLTYHDKQYEPHALSVQFTLQRDDDQTPSTPGSFGRAKLHYVEQ